MPAKSYNDKVIIEAYINEKLTESEIIKKYKCGWARFKKILNKNGLSYENNKKDITGKTFGFLRVIKKAESIIKQYKNRTSHITQYLCKCVCGKQKIIRKQSIVDGNILSCGCKRKSLIFKGIEDLSGQYFCNIKHGAKHRKIEFDVDINYLWNLFLKQNKKCSLSGKNIYLYPDSKRKNQQTASLDRIDSNKGYTKENVQWVHKDINFMKQSLDQEKFIKICKEISDYQKEKCA